MYKAAYGHLRVPQRFVVPNIKPWPTAAHNLKLGKVVANIRATGRYMKGNPQRRAVLDELGFVWRVRDGSSEDPVLGWEQVAAAYQAYRRIVVDAEQEPPVTFTIPDNAQWPESVRGLPLGRQLVAVKSTVLPHNEKARAVFARLGLDVSRSRGGETTPPSPKLSANDVRFRKVFLALQTYRKLYGDLLVPQPFAVPFNSDDWPKATWGLRLGARVNAIRSQGTFVNNNPERRHMLDDLGFVWSLPKTARRRRVARPEDEDEEEEPSVGDAASDLGAAAMDSLLEGSFLFEEQQQPPPITQSEPPSDTADEDDDIDDDTSAPTSPSWDLEGAHMPETAAMPPDEAHSISAAYQPPRTLADSLREAEQMALECGVIEGMTPNKRVIKGKREKDIPWFNDDFGDDFVFEDVVEALSVYKSMYDGDWSNLTASGDFVIPAPRRVTGFLDTTAADASARAAAAIANFDNDDDDNDDGGLFESSEELIAAEIRRLQEAVGETPTAETATKTTLATTQSTSTDSWPEHLAGMKLGHIVQRIRDGSLEVKHLPERKKQLDDLGFDWGDDKYFLDVPFEKAICAMYAYYLVRGDLFVYEDFVMPDEDPWPQALAGYEIGKAVKRIRELQNFLEAYHPEKVSLLRMIDFVWFSDTMALPLDPNEAAETSETLLLSAFGHPDYAKMIDIPMGLPDKIVADGPFMETNDDPKLWWRKWHNWDYVKDYWYQQGRRDNGYVLRAMGYTQMADEHEAKYGPGLFAQINATMQMLEDEGVGGKSADEKKELLEKLNFYRQEMLGCTDLHPQDRDELLADFDERMLEIMSEPDMINHDDELADSDGEENEEYEEEVEGEGYANGVYEDPEYEEYGEEEFDVEEELGLDLP